MCVIHILPGGAKEKLSSRKRNNRIPFHRCPRAEQHENKNRNALTRRNLQFPAAPDNQNRERGRDREIASRAQAPFIIHQFKLLHGRYYDMPAYLYLHSQSTKIPEGTVAAGVCFIYYTLTYISTATVQSSGYEGHIRGERERIIYAHSCAQLFYPSAYYIYIYIRTHYYPFPPFCFPREFVEQLSTATKRVMRIYI